MGIAGRVMLETSGACSTTNSVVLENSEIRSATTSGCGAGVVAFLAAGFFAADFLAGVLGVSVLTNNSFSVD